MNSLPINKKIEPTEWSDLDPEDRVKALLWMRTGIDQATERAITGIAYRQFCICVTKGIEFNPRIVWNTLTPRMQDHFRHSKSTYDLINNLIAADQSTNDIFKIDNDDDDDDQEGVYDESE